jgi:hypothetical protein
MAMTFIATISKASKKGGRAFADLADIRFENGGTPNFETSEPVSIIAPHGVTLKNGMKVRFKSVTEDRERKGDALQARGVTVVEPVAAEPTASPVFAGGRRPIKVSKENEIASPELPLVVVEDDPTGYLAQREALIEVHTDLGEILAARDEQEDLFAHRDAEAILKGEEAVLVSATSKATPSSETAWATIRPVVVGMGKILWQFMLATIDLGRFVRSQLLAMWRARKSAA